MDNPIYVVENIEKMYSEKSEKIVYFTWQIFFKEVRPPMGHLFELIDLLGHKLFME